MEDMSVNASLTGIMASTLQQMSMGSQLIDKTLNQLADAGKGVGQHLDPNKGNSLNITV